MAFKRLGSSAILGLAGLAAACGAAGDNGAFGPGAQSDGGSPEDSGLPTSGNDASVTDAGPLPPYDGGPGSDAGGADASWADASAPVSATFLALHASANLYDFRLCFGVAPPGGGPPSILPLPAYPDDPSQPMPKTNYPGVPVGGAAMLPATTFDPGVQITPYVVRAKVLIKDVAGAPAERTCSGLICSGATCLDSQLDYYALPSFGLFQSGTVLLAIQGCEASTDAPGSVAQCGSTYDPGMGNLSALVLPLNSPHGGARLSLQLAQLSPSFASAGDSGTEDAGGSVTYVDPTSDASIPLPVQAPPGLASPLSVPLGEAGVTAAYFVVAPPSGSPVTQSLVAIQYFEAPATGPFAFFGAASTYLVAVVGDATDAAAPANLPDGAANPAFDGHGLHVVAYPEAP